IESTAVVLHFHDRTPVTDRGAARQASGQAPADRQAARTGRRAASCPPTGAVRRAGAPQPARCAEEEYEQYSFIAHDEAGLVCTRALSAASALSTSSATVTRSASRSRPCASSTSSAAAAASASRPPAFCASRSIFCARSIARL